nr:hydroxyacid dehydrogenase [Cupriavidus sp. L7L]
MNTQQKPVVLVTGADLAQPALDLLQEFEVVLAGKQPTEDQVIALAAQHNPVAIVARYGKITAAMMDAAPGLRVISRHGSGVDVVDRNAAAQRGILVRAAVGANAAAVAEHAWGLILACAKSVIHLNSRMRGGFWDKATYKTIELNGRTLGIVGFGEIGRRTAAIGVAMGMKVLAFDPFATSAPEGVELVSLDELYTRSDVVSLHCPLTDENRKMINRDTLTRFKDGSIFVNTARGGLVDEPALIEALTSGKLYAAGLDSFEVEPFTPGHPFCDVPNLVLSPHVGGVSDAAYVNLGVTAARNLLAALEAAVTA